MVKGVTMATNREYLHAILFSGMLDACTPSQMTNYMKNASENIPKYVYKYKKVVGNPPTAEHTQIVVTKRYELEKISKYTVLHCMESQMRAIENLPACKALPLLKDAIDQFEKEHEGGKDE